jgi:hypothetical protein
VSHEGEKSLLRHASLVPAGALGAHRVQVHDGRVLLLGIALRAVLAKEVAAAGLQCHHAPNGLLGQRQGLGTQSSTKTLRQLPSLLWRCVAVNQHFRLERRGEGARKAVEVTEG